MPATVDAIQAFPQRGACTHRLDSCLDVARRRLPLAGFIRGAGLPRGYLTAKIKAEPFVSRLILPQAAELTGSSRPFAARAS
jgi:hypothetical protein